MGPFRFSWVLFCSFGLDSLDDYSSYFIHTLTRSGRSTCCFLAYFPPFFRRISVLSLLRLPPVFSSLSPGCLVPKVPSLLPPVCPTQSLPLLYCLNLVRSRPSRQFRHRCFPAPAFSFALGPLRPSMHVVSPLLLSPFPRIFTSFTMTSPRGVCIVPLFSFFFVRCRFK